MCGQWDTHTKPISLVCFSAPELICELPTYIFNFFLITASLVSFQPPNLNVLQLELTAVKHQLLQPFLISLINHIPGTEAHLLVNLILWKVFKTFVNKELKGVWHFLFFTNELFVNKIILVTYACGNRYKKLYSVFAKPPWDVNIRLPSSESGNCVFVNRHHPCSKQWNLSRRITHAQAKRDNSFAPVTRYVQFHLGRSYFWWPGKRSRKHLSLGLKLRDSSSALLRDLAPPESPHEVSFTMLWKCFQKG